MTIQTEALKLALEALEIGWSPKYVNGVDAREKGMKAITAIKAALEAHKALANHIEDNLAMVAQPAVTESHKQSTTCGEPVAWRYKPAREDNPRWEYTTNHPLDMGDGYIRPSLVEYCKCIEPLYAKEKPKLMLEKFREMEDLLEEPAQQEPATKEKIREAIVFNLPLYTTPYVASPLPQFPSRSDIKPLTDEHIEAIWRDGIYSEGLLYEFNLFARAIEAAHGITASEAEDSARSKI